MELTTIIPDGLLLQNVRSEIIKFQMIPIRDVHGKLNKVHIIMNAYVENGICYRNKVFNDNYVHINLNK